MARNCTVLVALISVVSSNNPTVVLYYLLSNKQQADKVSDWLVNIVKQ